MNTQPNFHTRRMSERPLGRARQSGAALLVLLTLVVLVGASAMLSQVNQTAQLKAEDQANTMEALSSAKAALIAYAVSDEDRPGELPCPDVDNNGKLELGTDFDASGVCTTMRGWFPWQTLKASDLRDGAEERLWYALSTDFRAGNAAVALNSETAGQLTVDTTTDDIVAVIITPVRRSIPRTAATIHRLTLIPMRMSGWKQRIKMPI